MLTERRKIAPLAGGGAGATGRNILISGKRRTMLASKTNINVKAAERIRIETPGGGGWGRNLALLVVNSELPMFGWFEMIPFG